MSTRCYIGAVVGDEDGQEIIESIYCHFDGYPSHVGRVLTETYGSAFAAKAVIALGDMSSLHNDITRCEFYSRDRGEPFEDVKPKRSVGRPALLQRGGEYTYLWTESGWLCSRGMRPFVPVAEAIRAEENDELG